VSSSDFKDVVLTAMREALAPAGFRKRGANFKRAVGDIVHVVQLQSSSKSTSSVLVATVNLGVFSRELERRLGGPVTDPTEADCHWRQRLGALTPPDEDRWWDVRDLDAARSAAAEVGEMLRGYALPALDALDSTASLRALWEGGQSPGLTDRTRRDYLRVLAATVSDRDRVT
jgi:hypothetical protein